MESEYETTSLDRMGAKSKYVQKCKQKSLQEKIPSGVTSHKGIPQFWKQLVKIYFVTC